MKKNAKKKSPKVSRKRSPSSTPDEPELPSLVTAMTKLVERLGALEQKMDQVLGRLTNLPSQVREVGRPQQPQAQAPYVPQQSQRPIQNTMPVPSHGQGQGPSGNRRERPLFQVVCADCKKNCEIPFKPSGDRPVYCKECFSARKSSQKPSPSVPLSPRNIASAYVNKKAGYPPPALPSYRPQGGVVPGGNTAVHSASKGKAPVKSSGSKPKKKNSGTVKSRYFL